jgi:hypothetical protein
VVNRVGTPQATLLTFLNFSHSHAFQNGGPKMIWDFNSSNMEKPNVDERELTMGFYMHTIDVLNIFKGVHKQILGHFPFGVVN